MVSDTDHRVCLNFSGVQAMFLISMTWMETTWAVPHGIFSLGKSSRLLGNHINLKGDLEAKVQVTNIALYSGSRYTDDGIFDLVSQSDLHVLCSRQQSLQCLCIISFLGRGHLVKDTDLAVLHTVCDKKITYIIFLCLELISMVHIRIVALTYLKSSQLHKTCSWPCGV